MLFNKIINTIFSFGAAIVIFGAWAKLEHKPFSDTILTIGMMVETGIFFIYGILEWRRNPAASTKSGDNISGEPADVTELTDTMKETNQILNKVFR